MDQDSTNDKCLEKENEERKRPVVVWGLEVTFLTNKLMGIQGNDAYILIWILMMVMHQCRCE